MAPHVPKYVKLRDDLAAQIRSGKLKPGSRIPTREELTKKYKVTRTTVNRALSELVDERLLRSAGRSGTIICDRSPLLHVAVVSPLKGKTASGDWSRPNDLPGMFASLISHSGDMQVAFLDSAAAAKRMNMLNGFDGVLWIQPSAEEIENLKPISYKTVITNRYPEGFNFVSTNHRESFREVTAHYLKKAGKEAQAFFIDTRYPAHFVTSQRREGFMDACETAGKFYRILSPGKDYKELLSALMKLKFNAKKPVLIISPSCSQTGAVLKMASERGLEYGINFFYCDTDNTHPMRDYGVNVTSILQDYQGMGEAALEILKTLKKGKLQEVFVPYAISNLIT